MPNLRHEYGLALAQKTGAGAGDGNGHPVLAYTGAPSGAYLGTAVPYSEGRFLTFLIGAASLTSVTTIGFHIQGTNDDLSGSPTWANVAPPTVSANGTPFTNGINTGRWPSISPSILGVAASSTTRTPPDGSALTAEQVAIEARRLVRFAANLHLALTVDLERSPYKHHRLVINQITGAAAPVFAMWYKYHMRSEISSHPYDVPNPTRRPAGFTDAEWAQYLDTGVIPSTVVNQLSINELSCFRDPIRPSGLSDVQWDRLRNGVFDELLILQHRPDGV
jgi:hypothetical protein